jgi:hypothetical protein
VRLLVPKDQPGSGIYKMFVHRIPKDDNIGRGYREVRCVGIKSGCHLCEENRKFADKKQHPFPVKVQYMVNVWEHESGSVKILRHGKMVFDALDAIYNVRPNVGDFDIVLQKSGDTMFNTKYAAVPQDSKPFTATGYTLFDLDGAAKEIEKKGDELQKIITGEADSNSGSFSNSTGTPAPQSQQAPMPFQQGTPSPQPVAQTPASTDRDKLVKEIREKFNTKTFYKGDFSNVLSDMQSVAGTELNKYNEQQLQQLLVKQATRV